MTLPRSAPDADARIFADSESFYAVMREVFDAVRDDPSNMEALARSGIVIRIRATQPQAEILVDARGAPLEVFFGPTPGEANVEIEVAADLLHALWLGKSSTREAFFSGKIKTKGGLLKLLKLTELFFECERVYPEIVRRHELPN
jgi:hypothetical protein